MLLPQSVMLARAPAHHAGLSSRVPLRVQRQQVGSIPRRRAAPEAAAAGAGGRWPCSRPGLPEWLPLGPDSPLPGTTCKDDGSNCTFVEYMSVRDYELDAYQVVNHAVYASYLQHARRQYLNSLSGSHDMAEQLAPKWALAELKLKYLAPLRSGDHFMVVIQLVKSTPVRFVTQERVVRLPRRRGETETVVVTAESVVVALDEHYRPKRIHPELLEAAKHGRPLASSDAD